MPFDEKSLRVFHISTSIEGGAGIAATRLHLELLRRGVDSTLISLDKVKSVKHAIHAHRSIFQAILGKAAAFINLRFSHKVFFSIYLQNVLRRKYFGSPVGTVLHVHNWFNLTDFDYLETLARYGFSFVFTLHDERNFTGGCHYRFECLEFLNSCKICPEVIKIANAKIKKNWEIQNSFYQKYHSQIRIIAPSNWIFEEAKISKIFGDCKIIHIPNFTPDRVNFDLISNVRGSNVVTVGVASMDPYSTIKGGEFLKSFEFALKENVRLRLIKLRDFHENGSNLMEFWSLVDVLLVPSILDNSPNVIHEAKQMGIPVIATNVGGIPELLTDQNDYIFLKDSDPRDLIEHLENMNLPLKREKSKSFSNYVGGNIDKMLKEYEDLVYRHRG